MKLTAHVPNLTEKAYTKRNILCVGNYHISDTAYKIICPKFGQNQTKMEKCVYKTFLLISDYKSQQQQQQQQH